MSSKLGYGFAGAVGGLLASPFIAVAGAVIGTGVIVAGATSPVWAPIVGASMGVKLAEEELKRQQVLSRVQAEELAQKEAREKAAAQAQLEASKKESEARLAKVESVIGVLADKLGIKADNKKPATA